MAKLACVKYSVDTLVKTKEFKKCPEFVATAMKQKKKTIDDMQAVAKGAVDKGDDIEFTFEEVVLATHVAAKAVARSEAMIAAARAMDDMRTASAKLVSLAWAPCTHCTH